MPSDTKQAGAELPSPLVMAAALGAFMLLGLIYPILGPALPALSRKFDLSGAGAAMLLSMNSLGAFAGVLVAGGLAVRASARVRAVGGLLLIAASSISLALAPNFPLAVTASLALGFGFGLLDLTLNLWFATGFGSRSAAVLNFVSAAFGLGAVMAPWTVSLAGGDLRLPLIGCAGLAAVLVPCMLLVRAPASVAGPAQSRRSGTPNVRLLLTASGFALLFFTYVGVEAGIGAWQVTHLHEAMGLSVPQAARIASLFWISFTVGRLICALLAMRFAPDTLIIGTLLLAAASIALAALPSATAATVGYTLAGLFLAPVFTTALAWMNQVQPSSRLTTVVFSAGFLGPVVLSPVFGLLKDAYGARVIPIALLAVTLACCLLAHLLTQLAVGKREQERHQSG
jgi:fucose permease